MLIKPEVRYGGVPFQEAKQVEVNTLKSHNILQVWKSYMLVWR